MSWSFEICTTEARIVTYKKNSKKNIRGEKSSIQSPQMLKKHLINVNNHV